MFNYLSKVLYIIGERKIHLIPLLTLFTFASLLESAGIGLIGSFLNLYSHPESFKTIPLLHVINKELGVEDSNKLILYFSLIIAIIFVFKGLIYFLSRIWILKFTYKQNELLMSKLLHTYLAVSYTFYLKRNTASIIKNMIIETQSFVHFCLLPLLNAVANIIITFILLILLAKTDLLLLTTMLAILLPVIILFQYLGKKFSKWGTILSETYQEMIRIINHGLGGIKETRTIGCESYFEQQMLEQVQMHGKAATLHYGTQLLPRIIIETFLFVFILLFISISQITSTANTQNITSILGVFAVSSIRLIPSASQFIQALAQMRSHTHSINVLYADLKELETQNNEKMNVFKESILVNTFNPNNYLKSNLNFDKSIEINNITFTYPEITKPAIFNLSLKIDKGESIALIGKSGAGKTTLVDIILGLLIPNEGDIQIDGISIYNNLRAWQNLIGYIPQSISLLDDTIERNIAFGVPDNLIDLEKLYDAIKAAQLTDLIATLADGIKTSVGERGVRLSGGQRQRIGIARALYFGREILVLDEATSALDHETESQVTQAIKSLAGTKTIIIIAHRLTTVEHCNKIYMLEKGGIVKSGSYQEVVFNQQVSSL